MSGKFVSKTQKKKKKKLLPAAIAVIVILLVFIAAMLLRLPGTEGKTSAQDHQTPNATVQDETVQIRQTEPMRTSLDNDLEILDVGSYTGAYVEDGTDEVVSGILMLKVRNKGEQAVEYAKLTMDVDGKTAEFSITTLKPGATIVLMEKNRMPYDENIDYAAAAVACENLALFQEPLNCHEDKLEIQILDGAINVTNIAGEDVTGRIAIYYKNTAAGIYYGGITYRVILEDGLKAGEIRQLMAEHFSDTGSEILFVTIAQ